MPEEAPIGNKIERGKFWLDVFKFLAPSLLGVFVVYGTFKAKEATTEQKIYNNEIKIIEMQKQLDYFRDQYAPRTETNEIFKALRETMRDTQEDVKYIRNNLINRK